MGKLDYVITVCLPRWTWLCNYSLPAQVKLDYVITVCVTTRIFLRHTADVWSDSGCPTLCDGCSVFALSDTSHPTWASVPMFSFLLQLKYFSDILWMSNSSAMAVAFLHYQTTRAQLSQVSQCFAKSEPLTSNLVQMSARTSTWTSTLTPMPILHYPTIYCRPSTFPHPADSTHCHFPRSSPIWLCFGCPSHVHIMSTTQIQTARNSLPTCYHASFASLNRNHSYSPIPFLPLQA